MTGESTALAFKQLDEHNAANAAQAAKGNGAKPAGELLPKKSDVRKLLNHIAASHSLVHFAGAAYAVPRDEGLPFSMQGTPGVAAPLGAPMRRKIARLSAIAPELKMAGRGVIDTVLLHLEARAFDGPETPLALRFHHSPAPVGCVCVDLGREDGKVLVIRPGGWEVARQAPAGVVFRRSHAVKPLPAPARGGTLAELAGLLALDPADPVFAGLLGWVIGLPFAASVRPGVLLTGPPGTGKSTRLRLAASVWEPSGVDALGSSFGHNHGDDQVRALHRAVPLWDNLTAVSGVASDALCCLITGTAREGRQLYTNADMNTHPIARPVGLSAVSVPAGLRPDALDRLVVLEVPPVPARVADAELQARFDAAHARLLGAACDAIAAALSWRDQLTPPTEYRMAAYARVLGAVDAAAAAGELDGVPPDLLKAYTALHRRIKERTAAEDVFGGALLALLERNGGHWKGKASELIAAAGFHAPTWDDRRAPGWPSSPRRVPEVLAHLREGLAALGVTWQVTTVRGASRYSFTLRDEDEAAG